MTEIDRLTPSQRLKVVCFPRESRERGGKAAKLGLSDEQIPILIARDRNGETFK